MTMAIEIARNSSRINVHQTDGNEGGREVLVLGTMYSRSDADGDDGLHGMSEVNPYCT